MPPTRIRTVEPCGKLNVTICPTCTFDAVASVESTIAVLVDAIVDASPDTMFSVSTRPRLVGSIAAMLCGAAADEDRRSADLGDVAQRGVCRERLRRLRC